MALILLEPYVSLPNAFSEWINWPYATEEKEET